MPPSDLCTIRILDKILKTGVSILKIEGRARSPVYVSIITITYKDATKKFKPKLHKTGAL
jgi:U32 family peptidase